MEQSANLELPYIMPSQAQKHVTHNEAIRSLDALVHLAVVDRDLAAPPASPADGDRYLIAAGGTGAWAGKDGKVAAWQDGAWAFPTPKTGWLAWVSDENRLISYDGAAWIDAAVHSVNPAPLVGVNATADATNRLAVRSPATLFDEETGDHRLKINKAAAGDTASLVFQSGYSGRAEFGLAGDDDWHVKVSADGAAWTEALKVDGATGRVRLPAALSLSDDNQVVAKRHVRELLGASRVYHVRTDGSDGNTGLADSAGSAFLTIGHALDVASALDCSVHNVTIHVGDGTWTVPVVLPKMAGSGTFTLQGNTATPANCILSPASGHAISNAKGQAWTVDGFELHTSGGGGNCVDTRNFSETTIGANIRFGACAAAHVFAFSFGRATVPSGAAYSIVGNAVWHWRSSRNALINAFDSDFTLSGTPAFSNAFAFAEVLATVYCSSSTFTGSATGARYAVDGNSIISTGGGGASFLPGNAAGSAANGGQYL
jgi:hypothetical protein